jgi:hypothetical protein
MNKWEGPAFMVWRKPCDAVKNVMCIMYLHIYNNNDDNNNNNNNNDLNNINR